MYKTLPASDGDAWRVAARRHLAVAVGGSGGRKDRHLRDLLDRCAGEPSGASHSFRGRARSFFVPYRSSKAPLFNRRRAWRHCASCRSPLCQAASCLAELTRRAARGPSAFGLPAGADVAVFTVPDPSSARVGSGGATLNALVVLAEELARARPSWPPLAACRVLLIHSGGDSQRLPAQSVCGKAWCALPRYAEDGELEAPIDLLLRGLVALAAGASAGVRCAAAAARPCRRRRRVGLPAFPAAFRPRRCSSRARTCF